MKISPAASLLLLLFCHVVSKAQPRTQVPYFGQQWIFSGFSEALEGERIGYFSVFPQYAKEALLTRTTDGRKSISWLTDAVPADFKNDYAYFTWIAAHSSGTSGGTRHFDLFINDSFALRFTTQRNQYPRYWTFGGADSSRLVFEFKTKDGAADAHGMAYLRVPASRLQRGQRLKITVVGQAQQSNDWYMTFTYVFKEKATVRPLPFVIKGTTAPKQPLHITVLHFGAPAPLQVKLNGKALPPYEVRHGFNAFDIPIDTTAAPRPLRVQAKIPGLLQMDTILTLQPVRFRELNLVHHSHTDIGYSHTQEEVIQIHTRNIYRAMNLIDKTKQYPPGSRFVWNIESAWAVENFLRVASPTDKNRFFRQVKEGRMVMAATYTNMLTGLSQPEEMEWLTAFARQLRDSLQLTVNTGMMSDIPGMSWSMVDALARNGIRYFSNGPNYMGNPPYYGDRIGYTLVAQGDRPFWWRSITGKDSLLFWTAGKGYSSWHGVPEGGVAQRAPDKIADYMDELEAKQYPYDIVQWRYNIVADNGPIDSSISDFVRKWNETYLSPRLVLASVNELFARFEKFYGQTLPVLSGDFTPYWEDGAYSTAREEAATREASQQLIALDNVISRHHLQVDPQWIYRARRGILLFQEHTWGAYNSVGSPDDPFVQHQWNYKKALLDTALLFVEKIRQQVQQQMARSGSIRIVNSLAHTRSGEVRLPPDAVPAGSAILDDKGEPVTMQRDRDGSFVFVAAPLPAHGERLYRLAPARQQPAAAPPPPMVTIGFDSISGSIRQLHAQRGYQWVADTGAFTQLLQVLYVPGQDPQKHVRPSLEKLEILQDGPVFTHTQATARLQGTRNIVYDVWAFKTINKVLLSVLIDKEAVRHPESMHIAFPFNLPQATVRMGVGDTCITPEQGQLPGANHDFYSVQQWIDVSGPSRGVTLSCPQGALWEVGQMINEEKSYQGHKRWKAANVSAPLLFLYAMNNYWHTNYKADQDGPVRFDFHLQFHGPFNKEAAARFGQEALYPLQVFY